MSEPMIKLFAATAPGFLLGAVFGRWGLYVCLGLFALYTLFGIIELPFKVRGVQGMVYRHRLLRAWIYSIGWIAGAFVGVFVRNTLIDAF